MDSQIKRRFTELLRKQPKLAVNGLRSAEGYFCSAGVLCELYRLEHLDGVEWQKLPAGNWGLKESDNIVFAAGENFPYENFPHAFILRWAGLSIDAIEALIDQNDGLGPPPPPEAMAKWVEANL